MRRAVIYNPYWDTLGGGEKYVAATILAFIACDFQPTIAWKDPNLIRNLQNRFGINLDQATVSSKLWNIFNSENTLIKLKKSSEFDSFFWVSDGSIPLLGSKKNLLHFQVPFIQKPSILNQVKINRFKHIICNSKFTKKIIDVSYKCNSQVLYPPVTLMPEIKKEKIILSVGRFDNLLNSKRQDVLIEAFIKMSQPNWKLVLAGGSSFLSDYLTSLKQLSVGENIDFIINPNFATIKQLYSQASIYWHAAGYGSNLVDNPEKAEHFGISTVEAMSAGAIPVVFAGGGQLEIVQDGVNGYLWNTVPQLVDITQNIIQEYNHQNTIIQSAKNTAEQFSQEKFIHEFIKLID